MGKIINLSSARAKRSPREEFTATMNMLSAWGDDIKRRRLERINAQIRARRSLLEPSTSGDGPPGAA
jgi:hypothetical protein